MMLVIRLLLVRRVRRVVLGRRRRRVRLRVRLLLGMESVEGENVGIKELAGAGVSGGEGASENLLRW